ncbi:membrane lipoprotein lipid attachment site-containing protein [Burkholderia cepacia]|uniref:Membrane lipoprotein lipid attachment site-containing protein n=1 Tax=Burkholderia cepacia TaxID=292 RepID=A0A8I1AY92_BURCE|nr:membrane lipoprotein lipid attachment site-containing protein [Burkholderia cepacia]MBH9685121.1 membrane lipoprotein lipid attachment site-containing protein [Burkholderia cepacia]MBH9697964.1 membrane lipoprotein lipid attachment site-containing protein [Burkholderia cepacia]MBH9717674.1 membrane lipoprotein lipid attachment site-containing protein [Burkholderia cepacia]MBH9733547.1 membrane lipoprotein lipid attachment site-containing protein [Burkholderia cepacia]MBX3759906.1 hypothetic
MKKSISFLVTALLLAACGQKLSGTYVDKKNDTKLTFESSSKVIFEGGLSPKTELNYEIDGKNLKLTSPEGTQILTLSDDGSIQGPMGLNLKKQ